MGSNIKDAYIYLYIYMCMHTYIYVSIRARWSAASSICSGRQAAHSMTQTCGWDARSRMHISIYMCTYAYFYICMYMYIYTYIYIDLCIYTYMHIYTHTHIYIYIYICLFAVKFTEHVSLLFPTSLGFTAQFSNQSFGLEIFQSQFYTPSKW